MFMDSFILYALAAGIALALVVGPLGSVVVWRRMAYFGDTLAHAALLGLALGFALEFNTNLGVVLVCLALAVALVALQRQRRLANDTLLGILSHSPLSLGLIVLALMETLRVDLMSYLFGDILAVGAADVQWIWGGVLLCLLFLGTIWRRLLNLSVHAELAAVDGVHASAIRLIFMLLVAVVIAVAMKIVGVLLRQSCG